MNNAVETIMYKNQEISICYDDELPESPTDYYDFLGKIVCFHRRYDIGHSHNYSVDEIKDIYNSDDYISLPIYMYDHSGITINTTGFSCNWDSGQVGIIFVSKQQIRKRYNITRITKKVELWICGMLKDEIKIYDNYLTGQFFGYMTKNDSCWGFDDIDYCISLAKSQIDYEIKLTIKNHIETVKNYIKNRVPLIYRKELSF